MRLTVVHVKTQEQLDFVLNYARKSGIKWDDGKLANEEPIFLRHGENTALCFHKNNLGLGPIDLYSRHPIYKHYKILTFEKFKQKHIKP